MHFASVIRSADDLRRLARDPRVNGHFWRGQLAVRVPGLSLHDQLRMERALNRYQTRCGCTTAAICFLTILVAGSVHAASVNGALFSLGFLKGAATAFMAAFVCGFLAKLMALQVTRRQFAAACRRCERELPNSSVFGASDAARQPMGD